MLTLFNKQDFTEFYNILTDSFPPDEIRSEQEHLMLLDHPVYQVWASYEKQQLQGFLTVWDLDEVAFIEHFAVRSSCRNSGLGSRMLQELSEKLGKQLCLEAELPETDMAKRRLSFYCRNGFFVNTYPYLQPALEEGKSPVPLYILTTESQLTEGDFKKLVDQVYAFVYKDKKCGRV